MMTIKEVREKNPEQLRSELNERQKHLFDLRSQAVTEKLEDPSQLGKTRKDIARILTVMRQREIEEGRPAGSEQQAAESESARAEAPAPARTGTPKRTRAAKRPTGTKRTPRAAKKPGAKAAARKTAGRKPAARKTTKKTKTKAKKASA